MSSTEIFLALGLGGTALACVLWALRLRQELRLRPTAKHYTIHLDGTKFFADIDEAEVRHLVHDKLMASAAKAAERFEHALNEAVPKLLSNVSDMNAKALAAEFEKSQASLKNLNSEILQEHAALQQEVTARRTELMDALDKEIVAQYQQRLADFDQRFNDVVSSFIVESFGPDVDLSAQTNYILQQLEQHKEQIKQDIQA
ncbi:MAG TPA: hypothetical protein VLF60_04515 [Candidatus Saccharimonadales bacterium]|nr:hypothetical protein [Candidatus Saccharimonadales bacterium]